MPIQGMTPEEILVATAEQVASGAKSTDRASKLPGETSAEANARLTAAYREMTAKPVLTPEMEDAGYEVKFVRKGAGGVGIYEAVAPIFAPKVENNQTTEWTMGIIPTIGGKLTGTTLGAWSNGDGTVTNISNIPFTTIASMGAEPVLAATTLDGKPASVRTAAPVVSTATNYTPAELQRIVSKLSSGGTLTAEEQTAIGIGTSTATQNDTPDDQYYTVRVGTTGKTQAQLDAAKGQAAALQLNKDIATLLGGTVGADGKVTNVAGKTVTSVVPNADGTTTITASDGTKTTVSTPGTKTNPTTTNPTTTNPTTTNPSTVTPSSFISNQSIPTNIDSQTRALIESLQKQITDLTKQVGTTSTANTLASEQAALAERQRKENALTSLTARFSQYGLQSLVPKIRELIINGSTESTIAFELQETPEYKLSLIHI